MGGRQSNKLFFISLFLTYHNYKPYLLNYHDKNNYILEMAPKKETKPKPAGPKMVIEKTTTIKYPTTGTTVTHTSTKKK